MPNCHRCGGFHDVVAIDLSGWEQVITKIASDLHEGKIKPSDLNRDAINKTFEELNQAASDGYGKGWQNEGTKQPPSRDAILLQRNLYKFSGAKTYTMLQELNSKMVKDGKIVPFDEFKKEALKLNSQYNVNHLQAEHQTASHSAKMAAQWENYKGNAKRFPNLKYKTQEDDRVREQHAALNNKIAPIDSDFWKKFYPPNGFRCRCYTVQTAADPSTDLPTKVETVTPEFEMNVAQTKEIFNETGKNPHPYFQLARRDSKGNSNLGKAMELSKVNAPYTTSFDNKNGGMVKVNPFADEKDLKENFADGVLIADSLNADVRLRPHIDGNVIRNYPNPEYEIDGKVGDRKTPEGVKHYNILRSSQKQGCQVIVYNFAKLPIDEAEYIKKLKNSLKNPDNYPVIEELIFIYKDKKVVRVSREDFVK